MKRKKQIIVLTLIISIFLIFTGCDIGSLSNCLNTIEGQIIGQSFDINVFNDYGQKTLSMSGSKIDIGLKDDSIAEEGSESKSQVLDITIDGKQVFAVGNTLVFAEKGLNPIDFEIPNEISSTSRGLLMPIDKTINNYKNFLGNDKTIVIYSQMGFPIAVYKGSSVNVEVPNDLPKFTRISVDGKSLYIHRANYLILDSSLIK